MDRFNTFKLFIEMHRNKIIIGLVFLISLIASTIFFLNVDRTVNMKTSNKIFSNLNIKSDNNKETLNDSKEYYYVDIKGEVRVPGVYSLEKGKRVYMKRKRVMTWNFHSYPQFIQKKWKNRNESEKPGCEKQRSLLKSFPSCLKRHCR